MSTTSEARIKANLENCRKSSGPRTPEGKANSRKNLGWQNLLDRHGSIGYAWDLTSPGADRCPDGPPGPSRPATWNYRP